MLGARNLDWSSFLLSDHVLQGLVTRLETMLSDNRKRMSDMDSASGVRRLKFLGGEMPPADAQSLHPFKYIAKLG